MARWQELSAGKTSNDLVDVLLTELASGEVVDTGGAEYFDGQVTPPDQLNGLKQYCNCTDGCLLC